MNIVFLPVEITNALRSTVGKLLTEKNGAKLVTDIRDAVLTNQEVRQFIGNEADSLEPNIAKNVRDVLVSVILDRLIRDLSSTGGFQKILDSIYKGHIKFEYPCRYHHLEQLLGDDVISTIEDSWGHYDIFKLISNFIELSVDDQYYYSVFSQAIIATLGALLEYPEIEYSLVIQTNIVDNTLLLITREKDNGTKGFIS